MSPFHRISAALAVAVVAVLATTTPASAHDQLVSSTPSAGEQLASAPESVSLTFSGDLIVLDASMTGALVMVVDESGDDWATGEVEVEGNVVTAQLEAGMPVAGYQVRWQVVSEDGHPISGVIPFTVGEAEPMVTASTGSSASDGASDAEDQIAGESSSLLRMLLIGAGGAAVAAAGYALYRFLRRPRATAASPDTGEAENL
ncbi:copper resistance CopC family protein [Microbacterium aurantiacum]|uniref:copper resistance CopC family protein n=1 Tax=Microbacterium aurantiacum TaxID=162393 RepID=UPI000C80664C|nr:copper resistance CopC family protein [Microbacterium aurantiacum]